MRKDGYYWVKDDYGWIIAEWFGKRWTASYHKPRVNDDHWQEIDERRIERGE